MVVGRKEGGRVIGERGLGSGDTVPPPEESHVEKYANMEACNVGGNQIAHPTLP